MLYDILFVGDNMKKKILCTALATTMLLTQTASAAPWQWHKNELIYDSEIGFFGNVTLVIIHR